jgi:hypothetical protein
MLEWLRRSSEQTPEETRQQPGLDRRHRDKDGTIARKHGNTLIGTLRRTYGQDFASGIADTEKLADVLHRLDERSLSQLVRDTHGCPPVDELTLDLVLSALHDSEINGAVSWFIDGDWRVVLGYPLNGLDAEAMVASIGEAIEWFRSTAVQIYPDSAFAREFARGFE